MWGDAAPGHGRLGGRGENLCFPRACRLGVVQLTPRCGSKDTDFGILDSRTVREYASVVFKPPSGC